MAHRSPSPTTPTNSWRSGNHADPLRQRRYQLPHREICLLQARRPPRRPSCAPAGRRMARRRSPGRSSPRPTVRWELPFECLPISHLERDGRLCHHRHHSRHLGRRRGAATMTKSGSMSNISARPVFRWPRRPPAPRRTGWRAVGDHCRFRHLGRLDHQIRHERHLHAAEKGPLTIYVRAAKVSSTFYVDPKPVMT